MTLGRPPKYESPKEMQCIIDLYFLACKANASDTEALEEQLKDELSKEDYLIIKGVECIVPTISGLAYTLEMSTEALRNYEGKEEFLATVKRAKQRVEMNLEQRLAGNAVTGSIFSLKNNFGWKDKTEQELSGSLQVTDMTEDQIDARIKELEEARQ